MSDSIELSDHAWTQEHAAAYLAGGLSVDESLRLEAHVRDCAQCAAALDSARRLDSGLNSLFAPIRPGPELEDFTILKFREGRGLSWNKAFLPRFTRRPLAAVAALLFLGTFGAVVASLMNGGQLPMPGNSSLVALRMEARGMLLGVEEDKPYSNISLQGVKVESKSAPKSNTVLGLMDNLGLQSNSEESLPIIKTQVEGLNTDTFTGNNHGRTESPPAEGGRKWDVNGALNGQKSAIQPPGPTWGYNADGSVAKLPTGGGLGGGLGGLGGGLGGLGGGIGGGLGGGFNGLPTSNLATTYGNPSGSSSGPPVAKSVTVNGVHYFNPTDHMLGVRAVTPTPPSQDSVTLAQLDQKKAPPDKTKATEPAKPADPEPTMRRVVIRSGDIEFEVESFDSALATVTKLVTGLKGAFVATVNSEKLPNGKVKGSITVRTPPEYLDGLVLDLRRELGKGGELKGVKITSQDITKQYTDLESRLRAARTMEQRLLQIIKEGKGEIKQLLEAEKELGVWRTKIEEFEGEIRYYSNLVSLSMLTITLAEKEIRTAAGLTESERVQAGVEVEDVDKAYQQLLAAVMEVKGRVSKSELKQLALGQFNASLQFEVAPDSAGPLRDRLRQLGRVARLEIDRVQSAQGEVTKETKAKRGDTVFLVQLYNLANIAPRETATLQLAVADVPAAYQKLRDVVAKATSRVLVARLNEQDRQNVTAQFDFEVKRADEGTVRAALEAAGQIVSRQVVRAPESDSVTDTKVLYRATILAESRLRPRETATFSIAVTDVSSAYHALRDAIAKTAGRVINARFDEQDRQNATAQFDFEVKRGDEAAVRAALDAAGEIVSRRVDRVPEGDGLTDNKILYRASLLGANRLRSRDTTVLQVAVVSVPPAYQSLREAVLKANGRIITGQLDERDKQAVTAQLDFEVKRADEPALRTALDAAGDVIARQVTRASESEGVTDTKVTYRTTLLTASRLKAREVVSLSLEVADVPQSVSILTAQASEAKARQVDSRINREANGKETAHLVYEVPLSAATGLTEQFKHAGTVRVQQSIRDPQAPEGKYATARIDVTLTSADKIVADNAGVWPPVKRGLAYSASVLLTSLTWVVFGLCVVLPWVVIGYGGYRAVRWMGRPENPAAATPAA